MPPSANPRRASSMAVSNMAEYLSRSASLAAGAFFRSEKLRFFFISEIALRRAPLLGWCNVFRRLAFFRHFHTPDILLFFEGTNSDLVRLLHANLADPNNAEARLPAPAALHVDRVRALYERVAVVVLSFYENSNFRGNPRIPASLSPKAGSGTLERDPRQRSVIGSRLSIDYAYFLLFAGGPVDKKYHLAHFHFRL